MAGPMEGMWRDLADQMTHWAQLQRDLADNMAWWRPDNPSTPTPPTAPRPAAGPLRATLLVSEQLQDHAEGRAITAQANRVVPGAGA